ncbi:MAG: rhomboid family intramembrane serine protease [Sandarakinorhabdus sp.]|jgi:membrane associated rhomboid family serine protease
MPARPAPQLTRLLLLANLAVAGGLFLAGPAINQSVLLNFGLIPLRLTLALDGNAALLPALASLVTHLFLHAGLLHLAMNMIMLVAMGNLLEPMSGARRLGLVYLAGGLASACAEWAFTPMSMVPTVGASGAISALIGAQAMLGGRGNQGPLVRGLGLAAAWTAFQLLAGLVMNGPDFRLAIAGHIGGFLAGLLLARTLVRPAAFR